MAEQDNSKNKGAPDDPRRAAEEGDPSVSGRSRGRAVDGLGAPVGDPEEPTGTNAGRRTTAGATGASGKVGEDFESGRHGAENP